MNKHYYGTLVCAELTDQVVRPRMIKPRMLKSRVLNSGSRKCRNAVNAPEVDIVLRFSKLSCAANVPYEKKFNYDAVRP